MRERFLVRGVLVLAVLATVIDFAGRLASMAADGLLMAGICGAVWLLHRRNQRLRADLEASRGRVEELERQMGGAREPVWFQSSGFSARRKAT